MKSLKKTRRVHIIMATFAALLLSTAAIGFALRDGINFYRSPSEVLAEPPAENELFRIGGLVEDGSIIRGEGTEVSFVVTDGGASIPVRFEGILPDLFQEGQGMIGQGHYVNGTFQAVEILAKHDEEYMPAEVADMLEKQGIHYDSDATDGTEVMN